MGQKVLFIIKEIEGSEPMGPLYIAGCLQQAGHDVRFIGTRGNDVLRDVRNYAPNVIAFGSTTGLHRYYLGLNAYLKEHYGNYLSLFGGPHPTYYPEVIFTPGIDVVCQGEGEDAAVELCNALDQQKDYRFIPDLWVKSEGKVYKNAPRPLRRDLDEIPFPPRELLYQYNQKLRTRALKSFTSNRGCPFPCSYCFNPSLVDHYGPSWKKVRIRSPENVVEEIVRVRSLGPLQVVAFRESIFVYNAKWLKAFGELYRREVKLPYYCHLRADILTQEMVDLLAWSGCHSVNVGIETANPKLANDVLKRNIKMEKLADGIRMLKRAGIFVFADNIVGIPSGTLEDDLATLDLNISLDVDYAAATICTPYPGTGIAKFAVENGYFNGDFERIFESYYTESVLNFPTEIDRRRVENLQKLFAVTAAIPALKPLTIKLLDYPPNDFFYAIFRAWFWICHFTDVMPRDLDGETFMQGLLSVFGVFKGDNRYFPVPEPVVTEVIDTSLLETHSQPKESLTVLRKHKSAEDLERYPHVR